MSAYNFFVSKPKFAFFRSSRILAVGAGREAHLTSKARRAFWIKPETKHPNSPKQFQVCFSLIIAYSFAYWKNTLMKSGSWSSLQLKQVFVSAVFQNVRRA